MSAAPTFALATPSYAGDFDRCRLLCASIDRFVTGHARHYLLVEDADLALFRPLEGPRRTVLLESALLPRWLRPRSDWTSLGRRRVWTGLGALRRGVPPLRGWHAQQLRKFAFAARCVEDVIAFADSDLLFLRPWNVATLVAGGTVRLAVKPAGITQDMAEHVAWSGMARRILGLPEASFPADDYIGHPVSWRREVAAALLAHVEAQTGRDWVSAIAGPRRFSEYVIYGLFATQVLGLDRAGHHLDASELARVWWGTDAQSRPSLPGLEQGLGPGQVALGVQSFIGQPIEDLRAIFEGRSAG